MENNSNETNKICQYCEKRFVSLSKMKSHMRIHIGERPCKCETCGKDFKNKSSLKIHEMIHKEEKPYSCNQCDKRFKQLVHMKTHERRKWRKTISVQGM